MFPLIPIFMWLWSAFFIPFLIGALAGMAFSIGFITAVEIVTSIREEILRRASKDKKVKKVIDKGGLGNLGAKIKSIKREGNFNVVNLGLIDKIDNKGIVDDIKITGNDISSDLREGMVLDLA